MYKLKITAAIVLAITHISACSNSESTLDVNDNSQNPASFEDTVANPHFDSHAIDQMSEQLLESSHIPGLSISLVSLKNGTPVYWSKGYGLANIESQLPVDENTSFWLGSISKAVLGSLLQIAKGQGILDLDTDIRPDLAMGSGFTIDDPLNREITLRSLATHSSGIVDSDAYECGYYVNNVDGSTNSLINAVGLEPSDLDLDITCDVNGRVSLLEYLANYLSSDGFYYDANNNFSSNDSSEYSNVGAGLAGHYLELKTGQSLHAYAESQLFSPLGMASTGWTTQSLEGINIATAYRVNDGGISALPNYELATYPDGGLRSSAGDIAKFLALIMNNGQHNGVQLIDPTALEEMLTPSEDNDEYGFFIELEDGVGHGGSDPGAESYMFFQPELDVGVVLIVNGDGDDLSDADYEEYLELLYSSAEAM